MSAMEIIRTPILPLGVVNAQLIRSPQGCILVDAGIPGSEHRIGRVLARHGLSFADIKLIVVTHAHTGPRGQRGAASRIVGRAHPGARGRRRLLQSETPDDLLSDRSGRTIVPRDAGAASAV
jgi:hypothetical protein